MNPDQHDYRTLLLKYLQYRLKLGPKTMLPTRAKEQYFSTEEWDVYQALVTEAQQLANPVR